MRLGAMDEIDRNSRTSCSLLEAIIGNEQDAYGTTTFVYGKIREKY